MLEVVGCLGTRTNHLRLQILPDFGSLGLKRERKMPRGGDWEHLVHNTEILIQCPDSISCHWRYWRTWFSSGSGTDGFLEPQSFSNLMVLCPTWVIPAGFTCPSSMERSPVPWGIPDPVSPQLQEGIQLRMSHLQYRDHLRSLHRHCFSPARHQRSQNPGMRQDTPLNLSTVISLYFLFYHLSSSRSCPWTNLSKTWSLGMFYSFIFHIYFQTALSTLYL